LGIKVGGQPWQKDLKTSNSTNKLGVGVQGLTLGKNTISYLKITRAKKVWGRDSRVPA
jgi:hypothetical protein